MFWKKLHHVTLNIYSWLSAETSLWNSSIDIMKVRAVSIHPDMFLYSRTENFVLSTQHYELIYFIRRYYYTLCS